LMLFSVVLHVCGAALSPLSGGTATRDCQRYVCVCVCVYVSKQGREMAHILKSLINSVFT
jgi:hypothetical protein